MSVPVEILRALNENWNYCGKRTTRIVECSSCEATFHTGCAQQKMCYDNKSLQNGKVMKNMIIKSQTHLFHETNVVHQTIITIVKKKVHKKKR